MTFLVQISVRQPQVYVVDDWHVEQATWYPVYDRLRLSRNQAEREMAKLRSKWIS